jgi:outer membrane protein assembly factor BamA
MARKASIICRVAFTFVVCGGLWAGSAYAEDPYDPAKLEAEGAVIGDIVLDKANVFDLNDPAENNAFYRLANLIHVVTKDKVIRKQLLFKSGDAYSKRVADESERVLRQNQYLFDAKITPVRYENGVVDLSVRTRDLWSLQPELSLARKGGENSTTIGLEESNLLGSGTRVRFLRDEDVDRDQTIFEISDKHVGNSWVSAMIRYADNSDGHSNGISAVRPFHELDARWSAGVQLWDDDRRETLYELGEEAAEYQQEREYYAAFGGWSKGLQGSHARRWTAGIVYDENRFEPVIDGSLPAAIPENRKLVYPFIGFELVEDEFETSTNRDQISRTEDFMMGKHVSATLGWADDSFGADRDALIYFARASRGFGSLQKKALLLSSTIRGRLESGEAANPQLSINARYYRTQSEKWLFFTSLSATAGQNLDLDNPVQLGGDTGLRGYPLRYQNGESKLLATVEQRYFTDWYPFRLIRVGAAIFADAGRVWGPNPVGEERKGWLADVGFGLRLALTRSSSRKVIHVDVAFPLNGDPTIDDVQFLLESRRSF